MWVLTWEFRDYEQFDHQDVAVSADPSLLKREAQGIARLETGDGELRLEWDEGVGANGKRWMSTSDPFDFGHSGQAEYVITEIKELT